MSYTIHFEDHQDYWLARVHGQGNPSCVAAYYTEACRTAAEHGHRHVLVDSHVTKKKWTFDDAESIATTVAQAANANGILAIAVVAHDPESNRDAEQFAIQFFKRIAVQGHYFNNDLPAAEAWLRTLNA